MGVRQDMDDLDGKMKKAVGNYDVFEDRVKSLLERWSKFSKEHPEIPQSQIVKSCMLEIDDGFTKALME